VDLSSGERRRCCWHDAAEVAVVWPRWGAWKESVLGEPIVLVVTDRDSVRAVLVGDLGRRFGADYRVIEVGSGEAALAAVADASDRSQEVALVIADQSMTGVPAIETLVRIHELAPTAKRILLLDRGDWSAAHPVVSAMALGRSTITFTTRGILWNGFCIRRSATSCLPGTSLRTHQSCPPGSSAPDLRRALTNCGTS
jgi:CheY-like chemotaxis protein